jgi:quercetin dioxygenase-like cupin family protein
MLALLAAAAVAAAPDIPAREPMATTVLAAPKTVARVETTRVRFKPGQAMPRHVHTAPVICVVETGSFLARIGDGPETPEPAGAVTYEPAGVVVQYFRNASATEPATLVCSFLAGADDHVLSTMLP